MLDRIDPGGDQVRDVPGRGVGRDAGTGAVNSLNQAPDIVERIGRQRRRGLLTRAEEREVGDDLDPVGPVTYLGQGGGHQLFRRNRHVQAGVIPARRGQEPPAGLKPRACTGREDAQREAARAARVPDGGYSRAVSVTQVGPDGPGLQGDRRAGPGLPDTEMAVGVDQTGQDEPPGEILRPGRGPQGPLAPLGDTRVHQVTVRKQGGTHSPGVHGPDCRTPCLER